MAASSSDADWLPEQEAHASRARGGSAGDAKDRPQPYQQEGPAPSTTRTPPVHRLPETSASQEPCFCQVEGCTRDIRLEKDYYQRYRICEEHLKLSSLLKDGVAQRFCQQCGRFHLVAEFDGEKRSCRARLSLHNNRRRKRGLTSSGERGSRGRRAKKAGPRQEAEPGGAQAPMESTARDVAALTVTDVRQREAAAVDHAEDRLASLPMAAAAMAGADAVGRTGGLGTVGGALAGGGGGGAGGFGRCSSTNDAGMFQVASEGRLLDYPHGGAADAGGSWLRPGATPLDLPAVMAAAAAASGAAKSQALGIRGLGSGRFGASGPADAAVGGVGPMGVEMGQLAGLRASGTGSLGFGREELTMRSPSDLSSAHMMPPQAEQWGRRGHLDVAAFARQATAQGVPFAAPLQQQQQRQQQQQQLVLQQYRADPLPSVCIPAPPRDASEPINPFSQVQGPGAASPHTEARFLSPPSATVPQRQHRLDPSKLSHPQVKSLQSSSQQGSGTGGAPLAFDSDSFHTSSAVNSLQRWSSGGPSGWRRVSAVSDNSGIDRRFSSHASYPSAGYSEQQPGAPRGGQDASGMPQGPRLLSGGVASYSSEPFVRGSGVGPQLSQRTASGSLDRASEQPSQQCFSPEMGSPVGPGSGSGGFPGVPGGPAGSGARAGLRGFGGGGGDFTAGGGGGGLAQSLSPLGAAPPRGSASERLYGVGRLPRLPSPGGSGGAHAGAAESPSQLHTHRSAGPDFCRPSVTTGISSREGPNPFSAFSESSLQQRSMAAYEALVREERGSPAGAHSAAPQPLQFGPHDLQLPGVGGDFWDHQTSATSGAPLPGSRARLSVGALAPSMPTGMLTRRSDPTVAGTSALPPSVSGLSSLRPGNFPGSVVVTTGDRHHLQPWAMSNHSGASDASALAPPPPEEAGEFVPGGHFRHSDWMAAAPNRGDPTFTPQQLTGPWEGDADERFGAGDD